MLEPRFGAELFATLLSIPAHKTLLRRHLSTHFVALIGSGMQQQKREAETQPGFVALSLGQKVKVSSDAPREYFSLHLYCTDAWSHNVRKFIKSVSICSACEWFASAFMCYIRYMYEEALLKEWSVKIPSEIWM